MRKIEESKTERYRERGREMRDLNKTYMHASLRGRKSYLSTLPKGKALK